MVAAAERAEVHAVQLRRPEVRAHAVVRGVLLEALPVLRRLVRNALADGDARLKLLLERAPERHVGEALRRNIRLRRDHAAPDVDSNRSRNHRVLRSDHASDGHAVAEVRVRHERDVVEQRRMLRKVRSLLDGTLLAVRAPALHGHCPSLVILLPLHFLSPSDCLLICFNAEAQRRRVVI